MRPAAQGSASIPRQSPFGTGSPEAARPPRTPAHPVDLVAAAAAARYSRALHGLGGDCADAALIVLTAQAATDSSGIARAVIGATRGWPIPVVAALVGGARVAPGARALEDAGIP